MIDSFRIFLDRIKRHIIQKLIFIPIIINLTKLNFLIREFLFGFENASNYLRSLSQPCIIPVLKMGGAKIGKDSKISSGIIFHNCKNFSNLKVGDNCYIGKDCFFDLRNSITIEDNVVIAMRCSFITHIDMNNSILRLQFDADDAPIRICSESYLALNVSVLMGVTIHKAAFVAANSLVNTDVESCAMLAGVPAKKIKDLDGV